VKAPQRGEVWLVDLGLAAKVRPAVVLSVPAEDTDRALVTIIPHTTSARGSRFEAAASVSFLRTGVLDAQNIVTIPHAKLIRRLGRLSAAQLAVVERCNGPLARPVCYNRARGLTNKGFVSRGAATQSWVGRNPGTSVAIGVLIEAA
jgi:mRNA interferase MazF